MATAWSAYLPEVLPALHGVSDVMAENAIRNAAIELCEKSWIWKYDMASDTSLVAAQASYVLVPPTGSVIHAIPAMGYFPEGETETVPVTGPVSEDELDKLRPGWREEASSGTTNTVSFFTLEKNTIRVIPKPVENQASALRISLILKPTRTSDDGADLLYDDWLEAIAHGAKWKLMVLPGKDWSNPELAEYHRREFRKGCTAAFAKRLKGGGDRSITVWPRQFGR